MVFNSYIFLFALLPLSLAGYFILNGFRLYNFAKVWLIACSLWFYGYFNYKYLWIIAASIIVNYILSVGMLRTENKPLSKVLLVLGLCFNLGMIGYFKYYDFFAENINGIFGTNFNLLHLVLPLGISFFTFQQLSFVIDSYRKEAPEYNFIDYALFVTYYPQLVAGPIVLHSELVPQFEDESKKKFNYDNFAKGIAAFTMGMGKKVLIADGLRPVVNQIFLEIADAGSVVRIAGSIGYILQLYFDFSGYSDMAIGIGHMFNIEIPQNFNSPLKSVKVSEFWNRWHMTLTRFFTQYLYIPLGGNRKGKLRTYINIMIVFLASGLWHGANWTFIVWGAAWGIAMVVYRAFDKYIDKVPKAINWFITFTFTCRVFVIFRADNLQHAKLYFRQVLLPFVTGVSRDFLKGIGVLTGHPEFLVWFFAALFIALVCKNVSEITREFKPTYFGAIACAIVMFLCVLHFSEISVFLYFNF